MRSRSAGAGRPISHAVRFYTARFPAAEVAAFLATGGRSGRCIALATRPQWKSVQVHRADAKAAKTDDLFLDAGARARSASAGKPVSILVEEVDALLQDLRGNGAGEIRLFSGLGAALRNRGLSEASLQFEAALEELCRRHDVSALCVYRIDGEKPLERDYRETMVLHDHMRTG